MTAVPGYPTNIGWYCPGCGTYHNPDRKTCPAGMQTNPWSIPTYAPNQSHPAYKQRCITCGIDLNISMLYVCNNEACPSGLNSSVSLLMEDRKADE